MQKVHRKGFWFGFNVTALTILCVLMLLIPLLRVFASFTEKVDIFLNATAATSTTGIVVFEITAQNPQNALLNAAEFSLTFDPKKLQIMRVVPGTALCEERFLFNNVIDNKIGTVNLQCGTLTPSSEHTSVIATLYAKRLTKKPIFPGFSKETRVLAHDGFGTDLTGSNRVVTK
jgi:hypothetical protein